MCTGHVEGHPNASLSTYPHSPAACWQLRALIWTSFQELFSANQGVQGQSPAPQGSTHPGPTSLSSGQLWRAIVDGGISRSPCCIIAQLLPYPDLLPSLPRSNGPDIAPYSKPCTQLSISGKVCSPGIPAEDRWLFPSQLAIPRT